MKNKGFILAYPDDVDPTYVGQRWLPLSADGQCYPLQVPADGLGSSHCITVLT